ncbi:MAG TPA: DNA polymerase domain-containing protein, partial [Armatimonadota bacterium]
RERNPDVIDGHNIFGFDLPFLAGRAKRCGLSLTLGRDGSAITFGPPRNCPIGGYSRPFSPAHIYGRQVIDTLFSVQRFDIAAGRLERHGLKECAISFGLAEPGRVYIPGEEISELWKTDPDTVKLYSRHDVRETRKLAELVCPAEYYLAQMVPDTYESVATTGTGEKINSLFIREYLRRGHAVPQQRQARGVIGGYTEIRRSGLIRRIVKCDVESLYPSLMLSRKIKPATDTLDIFLPALAELTTRRIGAKGKARTGRIDERAYWDGLQSSFKILINSFYGYLGAPFNFNDFDAAERVTTGGQAIVKQIARLIAEDGGKVIEIDTDGVYFEAPASISTLEEEEAFIGKIGDQLPEGINLAHDGRYAAMISLKIKNYILVCYDGKKIFRGASVRSRADEPFGREFIAQAVDILLTGDREGVSQLYNEIAEEIRTGKLPVEKFARRERVTSKTFSSVQKKRMASIAKDASVGDFITVYEKNNGELGLIEDYSGDENREHLLQKLYRFAARLREAFEDDFDSLFPAPGSKAAAAKRAEAAGQGKFELF